jgi:hypothetical protein
MSTVIENIQDVEEETVNKMDIDKLAKELSEVLEKEWSRIVPPFVKELSQISRLIRDSKSISSPPIQIMDSAVLTTKEQG